MTTSSSMIRQAQALVRACYYDHQASIPEPRIPHGCGYQGDGRSCRYCDTFPSAARIAADDLALKRRDKALARCGDHAAILEALRDDLDVLVAAQRTARLLGAESVEVHAFGEGWRDHGTVTVVGAITVAAAVGYTPW